MVAAKERWSKILGLSTEFRVTLEKRLFDLPAEPMSHLPPVVPVPQTSEALVLGRKDLMIGCEMGAYQMMTPERKNTLERRGFSINSEFFAWKGEE